MNTWFVRVSFFHQVALDTSHLTLTTFKIYKTIPKFKSGRLSDGVGLPALFMIAVGNILLLYVCLYRAFHPYWFTSMEECSPPGGYPEALARTQHLLLRNISAGPICGLAYGSLFLHRVRYDRRFREDVVSTGRP